MCAGGAAAILIVVGRCVIVDDDELFLAIARDRVTCDGRDVVRTATSQSEALDGGRPASGRRAVDVGLGAESGFEGSPRLVEDFPDLESRVVLISTRDQEYGADLIAASPAAGFPAEEPVVRSGGP
jgi:DNA-binding NarL/FixJ family response regulator